MIRKRIMKHLLLSLIAALFLLSGVSAQTELPPPPDQTDPCHWPSGNCLVPGTAMTWTDGKSVWSGNPFCNQGFIPTPESPVIDKGILIPGHHCPLPGSALNQPRMDDPWNSYCQEWYGAAPDIGACGFVPTASLILPPTAPSGLKVKDLQ